MEAGSICLCRSHLTADHLENMTAELFHCILPVATVVSKKVMHISKLKKKGGTRPADQLADGLLPVALRLGQLAGVTSPLTLVIPDKHKFPDLKTFKLNELT